MKFLLSLLVIAASAADKILVLYDNPRVKISHGDTLAPLAELGNELVFKQADDASLELTRYGVNLYKGLIVLAPSVDEFGGKINSATITEFVDNGGNVLIAAGKTVGDEIRQTAAEIGVELDEAGTQVIDHGRVNAIEDSGDHTAFTVEPNQFIPAEIITGKISEAMTFEGIGMKLDAANKLVFPIAWAAPTAYSWYPNEPISEYPMALGKNIVLVAGLQARNNARVVIAGSLKMFKTSETAKNILLWAMKCRGVLRESNVKHNLVRETKSPEFYTIMEDAHYELTVEELVKGQWEPFQGNDMFLDFHRLDPFVRTRLQNKKGVFSVDFKLPDVYGVFQFRTNYKRLGYTEIANHVQVSVRPLRHNQYERFISNAYPYYFSAFSMMAGVVLMSFVVLYHSDEKKKTE